MGKIKCADCEKWRLSSKIVLGRPGSAWEYHQICTGCDSLSKRFVPANHELMDVSDLEGMSDDSQELASPVSFDDMNMEVPDVSTPLVYF
jgi:hypothetical protein